jgi:hypothetical protein
MLLLTLGGAERVDLLREVVTTVAFALSEPKPMYSGFSCVDAPEGRSLLSISNLRVA